MTIANDSSLALARPRPSPAAVLALLLIRISIAANHWPSCQAMSDGDFGSLAQRLEYQRSEAARK